jgi:hypothetical protein
VAPSSGPLGTWTVRDGDEAEPLLLEERDHLPLWGSIEVLTSPPALRLGLDLPLGRVERLADRRVELLRLLVRHQLGAGDGDVHPYAEGTALLMVVAGGALDRDAARRSTSTATPCSLPPGFESLEVGARVRFAEEQEFGGRRVQ